MEKETVNRVEIIYHKGKRIIYGDFSGLSGPDFLNGIQEMEAESLKSPQKEILHLINFTDCWMNREAKERADKMMAKLVGSKFKVKSASFGTARVQEVIARGVKGDMYVGTTKADALEWLTR